MGRSPYTITEEGYLVFKEADNEMNYIKGFNILFSKNLPFLMLEKIKGNS